MTGALTPTSFKDEGLRSAASDVADDLLNRIDDRLWVLLPDLYGPTAIIRAGLLIAGSRREPPRLAYRQPHPKAEAPRAAPVSSRLSAARRRCRHRSARRCSTS